jgi:hypothetical protein
VDDHRFAGPTGDDTGIINMKSIVIYYSQTGNTKKIAEDNREGIGEHSRLGRRELFLELC